MIELAPVFQSVADALTRQRDTFNQADAYNGNHGDHMLEIFSLAAQAAGHEMGKPLGDAMESVASRLSHLVDNGSAQVYARGLRQFGDQFRQQNVSLDDLERYVVGLLKENGPGDARQKSPAPEEQGGDVLKALMNGLANWRAVESGREPSPKPMDAGYLFDLGVAYMQAKARGGSRTQVIADAAASVSPLNDVPYRVESGKLAVQTLLEALLSR